MKRGCAAQGDETSRSVAGKGEGVLLTVHLDDGVGDLDLVERHGRPGGRVRGRRSRRAKRRGRIGVCLGEEDDGGGPGDRWEGLNGGTEWDPQARRGDFFFPVII